MRGWIAGAAIAAALGYGAQAQAMKFATEMVGPGQWAVGGSGEINPGDDQNLHEVVARLPANAKLAFIVLKSPGGNLLEGTRMARTIRNTGVITGVDGICASACFLMWAAGTTKIVDHDSKVGVHSASYQGHETDMSQAVTLQMARLAHEFDIPPAIIGRMVSTPPDEMAWLSEDELRTVPGIKFIEAESSNKVASGGYEPGSALRPGSGTAPALASAGSSNPLLTSPDSSPSPAPVSPIFLAGRQARMDWEQWFTLITGDVHEGADWWAGHRMYAARDRVSCENQGVVTQAWVYGCQQARAKLGPIDKMRTTSPEFKAGWNSL